MSVNCYFGDKVSVVLFDFFRADSLHMQGGDEKGLIELKRLEERLEVCSKVNKLWHKLAMGISLQVKVEGSRFVPIGAYTPSLYALEYGYSELLPFIRKLEGPRFTEKMVYTKDLQHRFEICGSYRVGDIPFSASIDHVAHHGYMVPNRVDSLKGYFEDLQEKFWNPLCTEKLLKAINRSLCTSCSEELKDLTVEKLLEELDGDLFFCSDTMSKLCNNTHWITFVIHKDRIAVCNRGNGIRKDAKSDPLSGVCIYQFSEKERRLTLTQLIDHFQKKKHDYYLHMAEQFSGSCSLSSFDAGILAGIFFILQENHPQRSADFLRLVAKSISNGAIKKAEVDGLNQIMEQDEIMEFDPRLLIRILATYNGSQQMAEKFYDFLCEQKKIDWKALSQLHGSDPNLPIDYVNRRRKKFYMTRSFDSAFAPSEYS